MENSSGETRWFRDANGAELGLQPVFTAEGPLLRITIPSQGVDKLVNAEGAAKIVAMLHQGITFAEITGALTFRVAPEDL
ncbi:hypothetical protein [Prescottella equi]|uniref:hypothetical protein n=1 Tax=Rhodococcus hoagii TaxID=43767 RepID=UPI0023DA2100|nr:hypothetical protein [Prescottella equi]